MPNRLHDFKLTRRPSKFDIKVDGKEKEKKYTYDCKHCESQIKIDVFMKNDDFNRDVHRIYPHFLCISPDEKLNRRIWYLAYVLHS